MKYHQFSDDYNNLFKKNISSFIKNIEDISNGYCFFYPTLSVPYLDNVDFLIYGQAVNGWISTINENFGDDDLSAAIKYSNEIFTHDKVEHSPLDFVNARWSKSIYNDLSPECKEFYYENNSNYWFYKSFFWRVIYKLTSDYYEYNRNTWEWSKKLVWSNLYKIAPEEGANPNIEECEHQNKLSIELFKKELDEIKPKYCILLTNYSWAEPFIKSINVELLEISCPEVVFAGIYNNTKIIVTTRPFRGSGESHVKAILNIIGKHAN